MKQNNVKRDPVVVFRAGMSKKEIGWRMALVRLVTNRRKLEALHDQVERVAGPLAAKVERLKKTAKERTIRETLEKLGLLK